MQGEPLRWLVIRTPRLVSTWHRCRFMSSEAQVTWRPFCAVIPLCAHVLDDLPATANNRTSQISFLIAHSPRKGLQVLLGPIFI
jgi:hypothetical protein